MNRKWGCAIRNPPSELPPGAGSRSMAKMRMRKEKSAMSRVIRSTLYFGSWVGIFGWADRIDILSVEPNPRGGSTPSSKIYLRNGLSHLIHFHENESSFVGNMGQNNAQGVIRLVTILERRNSTPFKKSGLPDVKANSLFVIKWVQTAAGYLSLRSHGALPCC